MVAGGASISPLFIVLNAIALAFFTGGFLGLVMPELVPLLADPKVAWSLIGAGAILDGIAVVHALAGLKK